MQHNDSISLQIIFHYKLLHDNGCNSLYSMFLLLICFIHSSLYLLIPYPWFFPLFSVTTFVFCIRESVSSLHIHSFIFTCCFIIWLSSLSIHLANVSMSLNTHNIILVSGYNSIISLYHNLFNNFPFSDNFLQLFLKTCLNIIIYLSIIFVFPAILLTFRPFWLQFIRSTFYSVTQYSSAHRSGKNVMHTHRSGKNVMKQSSFSGNFPLLLYQF